MARCTSGLIGQSVGPTLSLKVKTRKSRPCLYENGLNWHIVSILSTIKRSRINPYINLSYFFLNSFPLYFKKKCSLQRRMVAKCIQSQKLQYQVTFSMEPHFFMLNGPHLPPERVKLVQDCLLIGSSLISNQKKRRQWKGEEVVLSSFSVTGEQERRR